MKLQFSKILVFTAFSFLLAHNFIPHHHHHPPHADETSHHHDDSDNDHRHLHFSSHSVDEAFSTQHFQLKLRAPAAVMAPPLFVGVDEKIHETNHSGFISIPRGHLPAPPFLKAFSFRGPPAV
jgi:hypothetical protein